MHNPSVYVIVLFLSFTHSVKLINNYDPNIFLIDSSCENNNENIKNCYLKTGTTIVGICCKDGYVLGADTRTTGGSMVMNKIKRKIHSISPYTHISTAGTVADCDYIVRKATYDLDMFLSNENLMNKKEIAIEKYGFNVVLSSVIRNCRTGINKRSIESAFIIGGFDNNIPKLYCIEANGISQQVSFTAVGSGSSKAYSLIEAEFLSRNYNSDSFDDFINPGISIDDALSIVRNAVNSGIQNDLGSGSNIDLVVVTRNNTKEWREIISLYSNDTNECHYTNNEPKIINSTIGELIMTANDTEEFLEVERI